MELHYKEAPVEMLTMGTMISSNKVMATIGARNLKWAITRLEKMKADHPDLAAVIQGKIGQKEEQQEMFSNPQRAKELAFGKVIAVLDHLEERLNEGDFLCGPHFTLADALFTCLLVSFILLCIFWIKLFKTKTTFVRKTPQSTCTISPIVVFPTCPMYAD